MRIFRQRGANLRPLKFGLESKFGRGGKKLRPAFGCVREESDISNTWCGSQPAG
jgi:hypothetical protein